VVQGAALTPTTWRATEQVPAAIDAEQSAVLGAERAGQVVAVLYSSGQSVSAGTLLVKLDDAPEVAQLTLDQARLNESSRALSRDVKLLQIAGASEAAFEQAQADLAEAKAQVALDNAALAQLNIVAPFAGVLGIRKISAGDYIQQGQEVAELTQLHPLRVLFSVPPTDTNEFQGRIRALSPQVDTTTNARLVEGTIIGDSGTLLPGMYGVVTLQTGAPAPAFSLPATALNDDTLGRYVYALSAGPGNGFTVHAVYVDEYAQNGSTAIIGVNGFSAGEQVVAIGGFKLDDGASVKLQRP
jgi:membrane fusion protein (multidrug efflux system)